LSPDRSKAPAIRWFKPGPEEPFILHGPAGTTVTGSFVFGSTLIANLVHGALSTIYGGNGMLPENEDHIMWSVRMPTLGLEAVIEALADDSYQISVVDRENNEWAKLLPTERDLLDAILKLQKIIDGTVVKYVEQQRDYRSQNDSGRIV
jgi:hypothetical protein